jgi:hypothetical protein
MCNHSRIYSSGGETRTGTRRGALYAALYAPGRTIREMIEIMYSPDAGPPIGARYQPDVMGTIYLGDCVKDMSWMKS